MDKEKCVMFHIYPNNGNECSECGHKRKPHIHCPFCGEEDFDMEGLKYHLESYCIPYKHVVAKGSGY